MSDSSIILGVCVWLADRFQVDVWLIRGLFIALAFVGFGSPILIYLVLYLVMQRV